MTQRVVPFSLACIAILVSASMTVRAQSLQPLNKPATPAVSQADFIVAVVNSEPITSSEVQAQVKPILQQFAQQGRATPPLADLQRQVLERLIMERAQLQLAASSGMRVDEVAIDQAEQNVARQNQIDVPELRRRVLADGLAMSQFRQRLRNQLLLMRLREREVESRVRVSDLEVEQYLREQSAVDPATQPVHLAQILVAVPEAATAVQIAALENRAKSALARARAGQDFSALVAELSDAPDRANGGQMGLRTPDRYPTIFIEATQNLASGDISSLVRSGAGFHILKVIEKRNSGLPNMTVTQSRARHILLRPNANLTEKAAMEKLAEYKRRIVAGQADFAALARDNSQDSSAAQGGDLGWASPGMFVPEFEEVMNRLAPGQISEPLISRFGVHLIQLNERRQATLSQREQMETVRALLREKKIDEAYTIWAQDLRDRTYVEIREAPL
jgi:peptidyl-prolyl cis-trans isomerase SurA